MVVVVGGGRGRGTGVRGSVNGGKGKRDWGSRREGGEDKCELAQSDWG